MKEKIWVLNEKTSDGCSNQLKTFYRKSDAVNAMKDLHSLKLNLFINKKSDHYSYQRIKPLTN